MREKVNLTTTFNQLKAAGACTDGYKKLAVSLGGVTNYGPDTPISLLHILDSNGTDDCLWSLRAVNHPDLDRIARHIACDCAESVLHVYEKYNADDKRPHEAIRIARLFADGQATEEEKDAAESAAWSAAESAARLAARSAAESAARLAAWSAARSAARSAAWSAAESAARLAAESAAWSAAESAARLAQAEIIRQYIC